MRCYDAPNPSGAFPFRTKRDIVLYVGLNNGIYFKSW